MNKRTLSFLVPAAVAVILLVSFIGVLVYEEAHDDNTRNPWQDFAGKANAYTDHVLETGRYHEEGDTTSIEWNERSCAINTTVVATNYRYNYSVYSNSSTTYINIYETLTYGYVFADDDCLRIEWHSRTYLEYHNLTDPSMDRTEMTEDHVGSVQYIPYSAINGMTVNEVPA